MKTTIEMAREAGLEITVDPTETPLRTFVEGWDDQLKAFEALVRADERAAHVPLTDELSNAVQMACQLSFKDHGRRSVNEQAWQRLMQSVAAYTHGITEKGQP